MSPLVARRAEKNVERKGLSGGKGAIGGATQKIPSSTEFQNYNKNSVKKVGSFRKAPGH